MINTVQHVNVAGKGYGDRKQAPSYYYKPGEVLF